MQDEHLEVHVFCDFDGTITKKDSGDEFFKQFSVFEPYQKYRIKNLMNEKNLNTQNFSIQEIHG